MYLSKPQPGEVWGTPYYVAPEVVKGQAPNAGSDIYSLGGTLYHVLTGEPPFNCETVTDTVLLRFKEPAPDPRVFKNNISARTAAILLRMLEMDSFARYPTYESLLTDIHEALEPLLATQSGKKPQATRRNPVVPIVLGIVAVALIAGLTVVGKSIYKDKRQHAQEEAQRQADIAAGRLKQVMRGGKLVWVRVDGTAPAAGGAAAAAPAAAAPVNEWTLPASVDVAISGDNQSSDFKTQTVLPLRGGDSELADASKIYLRFALAGVDKARLEQATLRLTLSKTTPVKPKTKSYTLQVWGLNAATAWDESITWQTAPGNEPASTGNLLPGQATLLVNYPLPPNPATGDILTVEDRALTRFLREFSGDDVTLVLTAGSTGDQKKGWWITATEDSQRFRPPTLILKAK